MNGPVLHSCDGKQFKHLTYKLLILKTDNKADRNVILKDGKIVQISNFVENAIGIQIVGKQFTTKKDLFRSPLQSTRLEIFSVQRLSCLKSWPITSIKYKALLIPSKVDQNNEFAVVPLKMSPNFG